MDEYFKTNYLDYPKAEYLPSGFAIYRHHFVGFISKVKFALCCGLGISIIFGLIALIGSHSIQDYLNHFVFLMGIFVLAPGVVFLYFMFFNSVQEKYETEGTFFHGLGIISFFFFWLLIDDIILAIIFLVICTVLEHHSLNKALRKKEAEMYRKKVEYYVNKQTGCFHLACPESATLLEIKEWGQNMLLAYNKGQKSSEY